MRTKVTFLILIIMVSGLFLNSCIDVFHYVGIENKKTFINIRFTFRKAVFEMAAEMSGETVTEDYFEEEFEFSEEGFLSQFPPGVEVK